MSVNVQALAAEATQTAREVVAAMPAANHEDRCAELIARLGDIGFFTAIQALSLALVELTASNT